MTSALTLSRPEPAAPAAPRDRPPYLAHSIEESDDARIAATARSLAVASLEIFAGIRRSESIARWVDKELLERIRERAALRAELAGNGGTAQNPQAIQGPQAGRVRVCRISPHVAEATVVVRTHRRFRAVALRLELLTTRWTMTQLQTM